MGKEYESELKAVPETVKWARALDLSSCADVMSRLRGGDLIVLASGGSLSAAHLLAQLHMSSTGRVATVMTPLEFAMEDHSVNATVVFLSASGGNRDILNAWASAEHRSCRELVVVCFAPDSKLVTLAKAQGIEGIITYQLPAGRDGFLATNSLVAFFCLILRLYDVEVPDVHSLPDVVRFDALLECEEIVVLYGGWLKCVAIDFESRFVEAALAPALIADYRNFAHGRHHWLAKRGARTALLAFVTPRLRSLAEATLAELPDAVPVEHHFALSDSPVEALHALLVSMAIAGRAAQRLGFDAGRPGVPEFGERIYSLATHVTASARGVDLAAVDRKVLALGAATPSRRRELGEHRNEFVDQLTRARFSGVVLDYDGTIVDTSKRFQAIPPEMAHALNRLLDEGLLLGIATGRGKSVLEKLVPAIASRHHARCHIGYYNGAVIRTLASGCSDIVDGPTDAALDAASKALNSAHRLQDIANIELRPCQITVTCKALSETELWLAVQEVLEQAKVDAKVVRSSHSVDVLPRHVSKRNVVDVLAAKSGTDERAILKIGDRGRWPGNDAELLSMSHGLSVDEVSTDARTCWNLMPFGTSGMVATLQYLNCVNQARYSVPIAHG